MQLGFQQMQVRMFFWIPPIQNTFERAAYNQPKLRPTAISVTKPHRRSPLVPGYLAHLLGLK
jgi:hypothetical protein